MRNENDGMQDPVQNSKIQDVWVVGEALIDEVPQHGIVFPQVGGGPANTAIALHRLGIETSFIGGISFDDYGTLILEKLHGVNLSLSHRFNLPTAVSYVRFGNNDSANYEFKIENTATFNFSREWLPKNSPGILYAGSLASVVEPGSDELFAWAKSLNSLIIFDPNVRPSVITNSLKYRNLFENWVRISQVVKMSSEDLEWLGYSDVKSILKLGPKLIVVTHGKEGISAFHEHGAAFTPSIEVEVVDTIGAGDTVGAVLTESISKYGFDLLRDESSLVAVLKRASKAAGITCSRAGANPPWRDDL